MNTDQDREALRIAHQAFDKSLKDFARVVFTAANGKEHDGDLDNLSTVIYPEGRKIIFWGGPAAASTCGVYEDPPGRSRPCTVEETQTTSYL